MGAIIISRPLTLKDVRTGCDSGNGKSVKRKSGAGIDEALDRLVGDEVPEWEPTVRVE